MTRIGRAKQITGTVYTNQYGLKMGGLAPKTGKSAKNSRFISLRTANRKVCGPIYYHGVIQKFNKNKGCAPPSVTNPLAGGVGRIYTSTSKCTKSCSLVVNASNFLDIIYEYFRSQNLMPALFADRETLKLDAGNYWDPHLGSITHYETGSDNFNNLPGNVREAVRIANAFKYRGDVDGLGENLLHSLGSITYAARDAIFADGKYGAYVRMSNGRDFTDGLMAFSNGFDCSTLKGMRVRFQRCETIPHIPGARRFYIIQQMNPYGYWYDAGTTMAPCNACLPGPPGPFESGTAIIQ